MKYMVVLMTVVFLTGCIEHTRANGIWYDCRVTHNYPSGHPCATVVAQHREEASQEGSRSCPHCPSGCQRSCICHSGYNTFSRNNDNRASNIWSANCDTCPSRCSCQCNCPTEGGMPYIGAGRGD